MLIVPTCQKSNVNLVAWGEKADIEKDRLLERVCIPVYCPDVIDHIVIPVSGDAVCTVCFVYL